jgi:hypothetical protein
MKSMEASVPCTALFEIRTLRLHLRTRLISPYELAASPFHLLPMPRALTTCFTDFDWFLVSGPDRSYLRPCTFSDFTGGGCSEGLQKYSHDCVAIFSIAS